MNVSSCWAQTLFLIDAHVWSIWIWICALIWFEFNRENKKKRNWKFKRKKMENPFQPSLSHSAQLGLAPCARPLPPFDRWTPLIGANPRSRVPTPSLPVPGGATCWRRFPSRATCLLSMQRAPPISTDRPFAHPLPLARGPRLSDPSPNRPHAWPTRTPWTPRPRRIPRPHLPPPRPFLATRTPLPLPPPSLVELQHSPRTTHTSKKPCHCPP